MRRRILVMGMAIALSGCNAPFWEKHKREDAEIARQEVVRAREHGAEETRLLLALCLDIAKFEKQWGNFAQWWFEPSTGSCTVSYKKPPAELKTAKQCADIWLSLASDRDGDGPSATVPSFKQTKYYDCIAETFQRSWDVTARTSQ